MGTKAGYIAKQLLFNAAAPVTSRVRGRGSLGIDGDLRRVRFHLDEFGEALAAVDAAVLGKDVLELGPGRTCEFLLAYLLAGGRSGVGVDVMLEIPDGSLSQQRVGLVADMLAESGHDFLHAVASTPAVVRDQARAFALDDRIPVRFEEYDGCTLPLPDGSIDLVVSVSVLEHVRRDMVETLLRELHRVLRPGGVMVHLIDFRDHMQIRQVATPQHGGWSVVTGDWLDALTYPEPLFRSMFSRRPVAINRIRIDAWCALFGAARFDLKYRRDYPLELPPSAREGRLQEPWRSLPPDVLSVSQVLVALARN